MAVAGFHASVPLDRTVHVVGNVLVAGEMEEEVEATANCIIHTYGKKGGLTRASLYDFRMRRENDELKITRKKITFIDDRLEGRSTYITFDACTWQDGGR